MPKKAFNKLTLGTYILIIIHFTLKALNLRVCIYCSLWHGIILWHHLLTNVLSPYHAYLLNICGQRCYSRSVGLKLPSRLYRIICFQFWHFQARTVFIQTFNAVGVYFNDVLYKSTLHFHYVIISVTPCCYKVLCKHLAADMRYVVVELLLFFCLMYVLLLQVFRAFTRSPESSPDSL